MKKLFSLILVLALALTFAGCQPKETDERTFIAATAELTGDFYTGWGNSSYDADIRDLVWGYGLLTSNPAGEVIDSPLVEEKTVSADLSTWTFKLKDGITFHNGEELTASDVKFTYDFYMNSIALGNTGGSSNLGQYVSSVSVDDELTITFVLKKVIYTTDTSVFFTYILAEDTIKEGTAADAEVTNVQEYVRKNRTNPIGYGAYEVVEYKDTEYVTLKAFEDYIGNWQGKQPAIKNLIVKFTPSETELDQLLAGEVDLLSRTVEDAKIDAVKANDEFTYNDYYRHGGGTIVLHTDYEAFQLTEVRQAFAYVLNRPKIIELFLGEYGIASQGPYSKNMWMMFDDDEMDKVGTDFVSRFEASLINYDILDADGKFDEAANVAKAQELLDAAVAKTDGEYANLTKSGDDYMWKGAKLNIKVSYTAFWDATYKLVFTPEYVGTFGFDVTLVSLDWPVMYGHWIGDTTEARQYHAFVGGTGYALKQNPNEEYASDKIMPWGQPSDNGSRFTGGSSMTPTEWDALLVKIENAHPVTGADQYRTDWRQVVEVFNQEVPIVPVYSNNYHDLYTAKVENFTTNALWGWAYAIVDANWVEDAAE